MLVLWKIVNPICIWIGKFNAQCTRKPACVSACGTRVCSLTYRPFNEHGPYFLWPLWLHYIFRHFLKRHNVREKVTENKMCVLIFSTTLFETLLILKKTWARYCHKYENMLTRSTYSSRQILIKLEFFSTELRRKPQIRNSIKIRPERAELFHTYEQTWRS